MNIKDYMCLDNNTKNILEDLIHVINLTDDDYSVGECDEKFDEVRFFIQNGLELIPVWYVRKDVILYGNGDKGLWVTFRPNLKAKIYKPDWLRSAYESYKIGRNRL